MAESLRRLTNIASFTILQEKLERWLDDYHVRLVCIGGVCVVTLVYVGPAEYVE